jgi:hypothetical protein
MDVDAAALSVESEARAEAGVGVGVGARAAPLAMVLVLVLALVGPALAADVDPVERYETEEDMDGWCVGWKEAPGPVMELARLGSRDEPDDRPNKAPTAPYCLYRRE